MASTLSTTALATTNSSKDINQYKSSDMVHVFGWMEDACDGQQPPYKKIRDKNLVFTDSIRGITADYKNVVKPRSQWLSEYRSVIKDVKMKVGDPLTEYKITFKEGVKYRGQPLTQYEFKFIPESSGGETVLKFSSAAHITAILPNFETREVEGWDEVIDQGANYESENRTITCECEELGVLRDEALAYAKQLQDDGINVQTHTVLGAPHGFIDLMSVHQGVGHETHNIIEKFATFVRQIINTEIKGMTSK